MSIHSWEAAMSNWKSCQLWWKITQNFFTPEILDLNAKCHFYAYWNLYLKQEPEVFYQFLVSWKIHTYIYSHNKFTLTTNYINRILKKYKWLSVHGPNLLWCHIQINAYRKSILCLVKLNPKFSVLSGHYVLLTNFKIRCNR